MRTTEESAVSTTEIPQTWMLASLSVRVRSSNAPTLFSRKIENCLTSGGRIALAVSVWASAITGYSNADGFADNSNREVLRDVRDFQIINDMRHAFGHGLFVRMDFKLRLLRRLVRRADAGKVFNLTGPRFLVEPLRVTLFADLHRSIDVDFHKITFVHQRASQSPIVPVWTDKRSQHQHPRIHHQPGDFADAPD